MQLPKYILFFLILINNLITLKVNYLSKIENEIVKELNMARQNPKKYAKFLEQIKPYYEGKLFKRTGNVVIMTEEGVSAVEEAIFYLKTVKPCSALYPSKGMSLGAKDHVLSQGPTGQTGHKGNNNSYANKRVNRYGKWFNSIGENICYGQDQARDIVISLIVDDNVPNRGHRLTIFDYSYKYVGVAFGYHTKFRNMCVITFAEKFIER